jgi:hypothetical protein
MTLFPRWAYPCSGVEKAWPPNQVHYVIHEVYIKRKIMAMKNIHGGSMSK